MRRTRIAVNFAALTHERWLSGVRRAPRALEDVKKVLTGKMATCGD
jgi:hypothetical protein